MLSQRIFHPRRNSVLILRISSEALRIRNFIIPPDDGNVQKKEKVYIPKINIILQDKSVVSMTKEQAEKWAKRRNLTLARETNPPKIADFAGREVYNAFTKSEKVKLTEAELKATKDDKDLKTLDISPNIAAHDFEIKLKQARKWLQRKYAIRIILRGGDTNNSLIGRSDIIKEEFKTMSNIKMLSKKSQIILTLLPMEATPNESDSNEGSST